MEKNMFLVTNASGRVNEYFSSRKSAIAFIVDEFAMTLAFRDEKEGDRLTEYMNSHDETPNQYPFKYFIKEVGINCDYDKPNMIYLVLREGNSDGMVSCDVDMYKNYDAARERFNQLVENDIAELDKDVEEYERDGNTYTRWDANEGYLYEHFSVELKSFVDKNDTEFEEVYSNE